MYSPSMVSQKRQEIKDLYFYADKWEDYLSWGHLYNECKQKPCV